MANLSRGTQVVYVPNHANGDLDHPDCESGFITSGGPDAYFVRYWRKDGSDLRTKSCSELTNFSNLEVMDTMPPEQVEKALREYC